MEPVLLFLVGLVVGFLAGLIGIGGGVLYVPILFFFFHFDIHEAISTSIFIIFFSTISSYLFYRKRLHVKYRLALLLESATVPGVVFGSYLSSILAKNVLEAAYSTVLLILSIHLAYSSIRSKTETLIDVPFTEIRVSRLAKGMVFSFIAGLLAGSLGISGGVVKVPILILVIGVPTKVAVATSVFMILITTTAAFLSHMVYGKINYIAGIFAAMGAIVGAQLGGRSSLKAHPRYLRFILAILLGIAAIRMLMNIIPL
ncbi:MAG: sulfite exporter TauE/SafE family protein [Candidatus Njordarchaeia archaeon]